MILTGCDIHVFCEARHDSKWYNADHYKYDWETQNSSQLLEVVPIYTDRCYPFFGLLAGVRCGWLSPIDLPRGIPDNASVLVKNEYESQCSDAHTCSWYTFKELQDWRENYPESTPNNISCEQRAALDLLGISYWQWQECLNNVWAGLDEEDWRDAINALDKLMRAIENRICEEFWILDCYSDEKKKEEIRNHANDFRIVFWFDN